MEDGILGVHAVSMSIGSRQSIERILGMKVDGVISEDLVGMNRMGRSLLAQLLQHWISG